MYFKHVNLIIITHACANFSGVLFAIISTKSCTYSGMSLLFSQMLLINKSNTMYMYFKHVNPPTYVHVHVLTFQIPVELITCYLLL